MNAAWQRGLYAITDPALTPPSRMVETVRAALAGGAVLIQYRDKLSVAADKRHLAVALLRVCRVAQTPLIINDDLELAADIGADGVHLGRDDAAIAAARARLGPRVLIGVSCYNDFSRATAAVQAGADYIAFGRYFASRTKPAAAPADLELLTRARRELPVPVAAIGGITAGNGGALIAAGADLLAVIHGVFGQADAKSAATRIANLFVSFSRDEKQPR
ncbi:MAG: thiamine phosphate synthase [Pseudomonadota bacterium]